MSASVVPADVAGFLAAEAEERIFSTGGQLYLSVEGRVVLDVAVGVDGVDRPVTPASLFAVYCAGKPAFVLALATLVAEGELSLEDRVGDVVGRPVPEHLAPLRVESLLSHTAGLHRLDAHTYLASPPRVQEALALSCQPPRGWRPGVDVAYSQVAAWHVLGLAVEALAGEPVRDLVRRRVLGPAGVGDELFVAGMTGEEYDAHRDRLAVNAYLEGRSVDPMLAERSRRLRCLASPAFGNTASARGLGRLYEAVLRALRPDTAGAGPGPGPAAAEGLAAVVGADLLARLVRPASHGRDPVMGRACGYGLGFMVGLGEHQFGRRVSRQAFGHSGYGGMTSAFCDPAHGLVMAFHLNGRVDAESALDYRRPALVDLAYRAALGEG